ncbi:MAG: RNase H family protein [Pirellulales bacterium]
MVAAKPHYLLFCNAHGAKRTAADTDPVGGRWHFVLERIDAAYRFEAGDSERSEPRDRLALLAVIRGLEALEQPSQVTLVTTSRYVSRGLRYGLSEWREADYSWEHFGVQKPVRNADLWQRIDGAMDYHEVACRLLESPLIEAECSESAEGEVQSAIVSGDDPATHLNITPTMELPTINPPPFPRSRRLQPDWWRAAAGWFEWWRSRPARGSLLVGV